MKTVAPLESTKGKTANGDFGQKEIITYHSLEYQKKNRKALER